MFYCRALYFISVCWASALYRSVLRVHCEIQACGEGDFLARSLFCTCVKPCIKQGEYETTDAVGLQIQDSQFHCLRERGAATTLSYRHFWLVGGYSRMSRLVAQALTNLMQTRTPFHGPTTTRSTSLCLCWGFWGFVLPAMQPADPDPKHVHPGKCTAESEAWSYSR